jgi:hypothetical protein
MFHGDFQEDNAIFSYVSRFTDGFDYTPRLGVRSKRKITQGLIKIPEASLSMSAIFRVCQYRP